ncbi:hypothetical protein HMPREF3213_00253 [Heyndrickxia coagulans]|uniref:Uncharacterized protein n=1 Tax=Heyndrickxia coagulans TaxID=1398 RepID=A0A133L1C5_HEYCO|nr:hypothetical protein HMPREF3213_00253 [Heyndrickxia coagulans]
MPSTPFVSISRLHNTIYALPSEMVKKPGEALPRLMRHLG